MNEIIKAHNSKMNRLVDVSQVRRANELDFFTDASIKYRDYLNNPLALNPNESKSLQDVIVNTFLAQAQDKVDGVLVRQTRLATDIKNMSQDQIKEDKEYISTFFTRLNEIQQLGGYLIVAVEPVKPDNLSSFIANYNNLNINGTSEKTKDMNMFMLAGWAGLFDYFSDVYVEKDFTFRKTKNKEIAVLTQRIFIRINGETFEKYLHKKPYIIEDFLSDRNIYIDSVGEGYYVIYGEVDSTQTPDGDLLDLYITEVPEKMDLSSTIQPQYFLGGSVPTADRNNPDQDTSIKIPMYKVVNDKLKRSIIKPINIKIPMYKVVNDKLKRSIIKPINTSAINLTPAYKSEINSHVAGLFALASGNISVLSGYTNPEGKASFVGNRYQFNTISKNSTQKISLVDAQKAFVTQLIMDSNLDIKLVQEDAPGGPSFIKETLTDKTKQGKDLIKALNENEMPLPDFYKNLPTEQSPELIEALKQYS